MMARGGGRRIVRMRVGRVAPTHLVESKWKSKWLEVEEKEEEQGGRRERGIAAGGYASASALAPALAGGDGGGGSGRRDSRIAKPS